MPTKIEWCDEVWNVVTGCTKISPGCKNCYAEKIMNRFSPVRIFSFVNMHPYRMVYPKRWKKPRSVFVCSMGDLFHESVNFLFIDAVFNMTQEVDRHTYLVLTKRPERVVEYFNSFEQLESDLPNVWFGVSVEDQKTADERIPILLQIPAVKRFVSVEPMLEKINLIDYLPELNWVIAGCESGPKRRPAKIDWFRSLRDQCQYIDPPAVPFFLKQTSGYITKSERHGLVSKPGIVKMPELDGKIWSQKPKGEKA